MNTRAVVENYFDALTNGRFDEIGKYKSATSTYWLGGEGSWPFGGWHDEQSLGKMVANIQDRFPTGLRMTVERIIVEGEQAAVYLTSAGTRKDGKEYRNNVVILVVVKDGVIVEQREFLDTIRVNDVFCGPMS